MVLDREIGNLVEEKIRVAEEKGKDDQAGNEEIIADRSHAIFPNDIKSFARFLVKKFLGSPCREVRAP